MNFRLQISYRAEIFPNELQITMFCLASIIFLFLLSLKILAASYPLDINFDISRPGENHSGARDFYKVKYRYCSRVINPPITKIQSLKRKHVEA